MSTTEPPSTYSATPKTGPSDRIQAISVPAVAGLAFVVATAVCIVLSAGGPTPGDSSAELTRSLTMPGFDDRIRAAGLLYGLGAVGFLMYVAGLVDRIRRGASLRGAALVVLASGVVVIGLELASAALIAAYPDTVRLFGAEAATNLPVALTVQTVSWWAAEYAGLVAVLMMGATGLAGLRTGSLPRWFGWMSLATAVLSLVAAVVNLAPVALLVWTAAGGIALLSRTPQTSA